MLRGLYHGVVTPGPRIDERILAAAERTLAEVGLQRATLERIAGEAGMSRVTLHRRGVTKDAIVAALTNRAVSAYREAMWPVLTGPRSAYERLELALETLCRVAENHIELLIGLGAESGVVFHEEGEAVLTRTAFTEPLERLLRDGIQEGSVRAVDPTETATVLFNLVGWTYIHLRSGHGWGADRSKRSTLDIALRGLVAPVPASTPADRDTQSP